MAEKIIANLTLDTYQRNKILPLVIPQHDYGARYIRVRITEQGENVSVASGSVVSIIAERKADGSSAAFSGSVNADGSVLVPVTQWMLDAPSDDVDCHVAVTGTGYQYSTTSFVISPQERENPSYLEEDDPRVNIVEEALIKVVEEADRAEEQANLAASNAKAEVERLVGELGVVQETGVSITSVMAQGASSRSFANAIKGEESGGAVLCEEVSPVLHPVVVGVRSENLIPFPYVFGTSTTDGGLTFDSNSDGFITVNGTAERSIFIKIADINALNGDYFISGCPAGGADNTYHVIVDENSVGITRDYGSGAKFSASNNNTYSVVIRIEQGSVVSNLVFKPMLNKGTTAEPYTPFVPDGTEVKVTSAGANLLNPVAYLNSSRETTLENDVFTTNFKDGALYFNGDKINKIRAGTYTFSIRKVSDSLHATLILYRDDTGATLNIYYIDGDRDITFTANHDFVITMGGLYVENNDYYKTYSYKVQLVVGQPIPYEPYKAGQTIDTAVGSTIDLPSIAPYMSVYTNTEGTAVDVTYVKDTNAVVQKLVNAIVALGGNV